MRDGRHQLGQNGENLAVHYLQQKGYTVLQTNWRCQYGEIDIIARDGAVVVFVEVRTRRAMTTEPALESITPRKQARLVRLAQAYLNAMDMDDTRWRIDLIAIAMPYRGQPIIEHLEDGLGW